MSSSIRTFPPVNDSWLPFKTFDPLSLLSGGWQELIDSLVVRDPKFAPLEVLPCANVQVEPYTACEKPGRLACSLCKLVSYCTKECQKTHWGIHKRDCKDAIRSTKWKPAWIVEGRVPTFINKANMSTAEEFAQRFREKLAIGLSLWGNIPAMDVVNLSNNEKDSSANLSLAFAASGDLRHIVTTVNALGPEYTGRVNIVLNDVASPLVSRNIILLLILGMIPDEVVAAEIALHFWYSVFMPMEYRVRILSMVTSLLKNGGPGEPIVTALGSRSRLTCLVPVGVQELLMSNAGPMLSTDQAQTEYERVRTAPTRLDYRDRMYMGLKPSHRLAFLGFRRFGVVLPFGAANAHFNAPNPSLFSLSGEWLQTDYADPLESWDLDKVFESGKARGAQSEDVYGCLYFFLSDQLRTFARRIREYPISFYVFNSEACALAKEIIQGTYMAYGIPPTLRFDRIDVSNIMDPNYVGPRSVLKVWGPLLAKSDNTALTGYFMNWMAYAEKGCAVDAGTAVIMNIMEAMIKNDRVQRCLDPGTTAAIAMSNLDTYYDNSKAFSKFFKDRGLESVERETKLKLREKHKIIPHRVRTPVDGRSDALPQFADDETWYRHTRLVNMTWTERFVEFAHAK
ncbi:hypothetical protein PAXRUDRAFT_133868 [Paxillus rubicundulus Ve08.2h10]|uniref:MYND-type domain-containing protein n=1 Tax=Paxillus rubicundulus Ve08.2h10 TaxID=930991 RepID=A0A0D0DJK5_9AGAM|nr:hypothetical protein PAXRUDRAFT_133868 [Paxillus rubicundulus Ve08.2h10]